MAPPRASLASFWFNVAGADNQDSGSPLFTMSAPVGSVCDLDVEFIILDFDGAENANQSLTLVGSASIGYVYYNFLDNTVPAGTTGLGYWRPQGPLSQLLAYGP
jgi:hypothetical protein